MDTVSKDVLLVREQINKLKVKEKQLLKRDKENERKARTKRLIERGALVEKYFSLDDTFSNEHLKSLFDIFINDENFISLLEKSKNVVTNTSLTE